MNIVESTLIDFWKGEAENPTKVATYPDDSTMAIAMLAYVPRARCFGVKSYAERTDTHGVSAGSLLTLLDDRTGLPLAVMDCDWITSARTGVVTALMIRELSRTPEHVLIVGAGRQTQGIVSALLHEHAPACRVSIATSSQAAFDAVLASLPFGAMSECVGRCDNIFKDAADADVVIGAAGPLSVSTVSLNMLKPGALAIYVGHGLHADILHGADKVVATSESQMNVTGQDLADDNGLLPSCDAELGAILAGEVKFRGSSTDVVAAYNSGLAVTDVAVGRCLMDSLLALGGGSKVVGFTPVPFAPTAVLRSGAA
jgi:ornithine cyclodeaminase/alanine dehydrogenase-like protein (mu-crystallin family)